MTRLIDISVPLQEGMPCWPGHDPFRAERFRKMEDGAPCNITRLAVGAHAGTHVDAPFHSLADGHGVEAWPLDAFIGRAYVADVGEAPIITPAVLDRCDIPHGVERLLFKSRNSAFWDDAKAPFHEDFTAFTDGGAAWVAERAPKLIGIDYLSVELFANPDRHSTHRILLKAGIALLEGLDLRAVAPGFYDLLCLPLKIVGADGAPARAALRTLT